MSAISSKSDLLALLEDLTSKVNALPDDVTSNDESRIAAQATASKITAALDRPVDTVRQIWYELHRSTGVRIAIEGGWLEALEKGRTMTAGELGKATGAEEMLIVRIMRLLTSTRVVAESGVDTYSATPISALLTVPTVRDGCKHFFDNCARTYVELPNYFARNGFKVPNDPLTGPWPSVWGGKTFWETLEAEPERGGVFDTFMTNWKVGRVKWLDAYPFEEQLGRGLSQAEDAVLLVDIGGGHGHELLELKTRFLDMPGRLIVQDQPGVIAQVDSQEIEPMAHDFFTPQPIKGARAYYLRAILHDWPDSFCRKILQNIVPAMTSGYSRILINDLVLPDTNVSFQAAGLDLVVMACLTGAERTLKQWHEMLESVGLRIEKVWTVDPGTESIIEAVLI